MSQEIITHQPITQITQSEYASCVPASVSMAFNGFGIPISERKLMDKYFPGVNNNEDEYGGVFNEDIVKGVISVIRGENLSGLSVDVFDPSLWRFTKSREPKYIT